MESTVIHVINACTMPTTENNLPLHVSDFDRICRTCFSTQKIQSIFTLKYNDISIVNFLHSSASIEVIEICLLIIVNLNRFYCVQVEQNDDLPQNLCWVCLQEIIRIHVFQEKCKQNENYLKLIATEQKILKRDEEDSIKQNVDYEIPISYSDSDSEIKVDDKRKVSRKIKEENHVVSCRDCGKKFPTKDELKQHRKEMKHKEVRNHSCSVCSKMFTSSKLRQHMRTHTKEKPYVCSICKQGFSMSGNLKRHMMTHTGERPHVCEFCGKGQ